MNRGNLDPLATPKVMAVLIHWGSIADTRTCVTSLLQQDYAALSVAILDNGTHSNWNDILGDLREQVEVIDLADNTGFSGGVNQAIAAIKARNIRWGWILNNDTVFPEKDSIKVLVEFASGHDACLFTPQLLNRSGSRLRPCSGGLFFPSLALALHNTGWLAGFLQRLFRSQPFLSGTAWFVDVERAPDPLLDESFFAYFEDVDLGLRLGAPGMAVCDNTSIVHEVSASTGGGLKKYYLKARNVRYLARKHDLLSVRFRVAFYCVFVPSEARKYIRQLPQFIRETRRALRDTQAM